MEYDPADPTRTDPTREQLRSLASAYAVIGSSAEVVGSIGRTPLPNAPKAISASMLPPPGGGLGPGHHVPTYPEHTSMYKLTPAAVPMRYYGLRPATRRMGDLTDANMTMASLTYASEDIMAELVPIGQATTPKTLPLTTLSGAKPIPLADRDNTPLQEPTNDDGSQYFTVGLVIAAVLFVVYMT